MIDHIDYDDEQDIKELLMWRTVEVVGGDEYEAELLLDNGVRLTIVTNQGGCSCGAGDYYIERLNGTPNAITNVVVEEVVDDDEMYEPDRSFLVHVLTENKEVQTLWEIKGNDGSGYYGTGYWIKVTPPKEES